MSNLLTYKYAYDNSVLEYQSEFIDILGAKISLDIVEIFHYNMIEIGVDKLEDYFERVIQTAEKLKDNGITKAGILEFKKFIFFNYNECKFYYKFNKNSNNDFSSGLTSLIISLNLNNLFIFSS